MFIGCVLGVGVGGGVGCGVVYFGYWDLYVGIEDFLLGCEVVGDVCFEVGYMVVFG